MNNMFSYDSKLMSVLSYIGDLFILNILFLVSCVPVVTIGAALAGLHNAARILRDPEDDRSVVRAYFRGMKEGFFKITFVSIIFLIIDVILYYTLYVAYVNQDSGMFIHWAVPLVALCLAAIYQQTIAQFHSQFSCTVRQLFRNSAMMMLWHPLVCLLSALLLCIPMLIYFLLPDLFITITPLFLTVYFSMAAIGAAILNKKSFQALIDHYNDPEAIDRKEEPEEASEEVVEEDA